MANGRRSWIGGGAPRLVVAAREHCGVCAASWRPGWNQRGTAGGDGRAPRSVSSAAGRRPRRDARGSPGLYDTHYHTLVGGVGLAAPARPAMTIAYISSSDCGRHDTGWGHPEHVGRLRAIPQALREEPEFLGRIQHVESRHATPEELEIVH